MNNYALGYLAKHSWLTIITTPKQKAEYDHRYGFDFAERLDGGGGGTWMVNIIALPVILSGLSLPKQPKRQGNSNVWKLSSKSLVDFLLEKDFRPVNTHIKEHFDSGGYNILPADGHWAAGANTEPIIMDVYDKTRPEYIPSYLLQGNGRNRTLRPLKIKYVDGIYTLTGGTYPVRNDLKLFNFRWLAGNATWVTDSIDAVKSFIRYLDSKPSLNLIIDSSVNL